MASLSQIQEALEICQYLEDANQKKDPLCRNASLCKDKLNDTLLGKGYEILEMMDLIPFPHHLCTGIVLRYAQTNSLYVYLSGTFNWCQRTTPNLWDRAVHWNGQGLVAQSFVDAASAIVDTIRRTLRVMPIGGQQRSVRMIGFGLGSPITYLIAQVISPFAKELGFRVESPLLFACPRFVDSTFQLGFRPTIKVISYALQDDLSPRMPVTPLNWQWTWPVAPTLLDGGSLIAEDPPNPAQTTAHLPKHYLQRLRI